MLDFKHEILIVVVIILNIPSIQLFVDKLVAGKKSSSRLCGSFWSNIGQSILVQPLKVLRALQHIWNPVDSDLKRKHDNLKVRLEVLTQECYTKKVLLKFYEGH